MNHALDTHRDYGTNSIMPYSDAVTASPCRRRYEGEPCPLINRCKKNLFCKRCDPLGEPIPINELIDAIQNNTLNLIPPVIKPQPIMEYSVRSESIQTTVPCEFSNCTAIATSRHVRYGCYCDAHIKVIRGRIEGARRKGADVTVEWLRRPLESRPIPYGDCERCKSTPAIHKSFGFNLCRKCRSTVSSRRKNKISDPVALLRYK